MASPLCTSCCTRYHQRNGGCWNYVTAVDIMCDGVQMGLLLPKSPEQGSAAYLPRAPPRAMAPVTVRTQTALMLSRMMETAQETSPMFSRRGRCGNGRSIMVTMRVRLLVNGLLASLPSSCLKL